jgi:hypothetical protein
MACLLKNEPASGRAVAGGVKSLGKGRSPSDSESEEGAGLPGRPGGSLAGLGAPSQAADPKPGELPMARVKAL